MYVEDRAKRVKETVKRHLARSWRLVRQNRYVDIIIRVLGAIASAIRTVVLVIREFVVITSTVLATLIFLPGVATRTGLRTMVARWKTLAIEHRAFYRSFGGDFTVTPAPSGWTKVSLELIPMLGLFFIGALTLLPIIVRLEVLGVSFSPQLTRDPSLLLRDDLGKSVVLELITWHGGWDLLRLWVGVSCWFCLAPRYTDIKAVRTTLSRCRPRVFARALRASLWPVAAITRLFSIFDEATMWLGRNVLIAGGGLTALLLFGLERRLIAFLY